LQSDEVQFQVEVAGVADDRPVPHRLEVLRIDYMSVACDGDEYLSERCRLRDLHNAEAVHGRLESLDRVDLSDYHVSAHSAGAHCDTFTAPSVTDHDKSLARKKDVGRADDAVKCALPSAIPVVKKMLGLRVVDRD